MSKHWPLREQFRIRLTMTSDWHIGSGMGRPGNVDRLILRDADDLPFVPAKTLHGIWRDACERLCYGLDNGQLGTWSRWVDLLFGSQPALGKDDPTGRHYDSTLAPRESAVRIRSARIPKPLREQLVRADRRVRQAMTFIKPGVKIDRRSGSAQTDFLRFEELTRKGTILEADCLLPIEGTPRETASALLIASTKLVERLGGKRRRGPGSCHLEILEADADAAITWLQQTETAPEWLPTKQVQTSSNVRHTTPKDDSWFCVPLVLELQGPLAISYRTTGNVVETLDFMPGSYLLPHVTRTLGRLEFDVRAAVPAGDICVLPATPEVDGERSQPAPLALFAPKGGKGLEEPDRVVNRLLQVEPTDGTQLKQIREGYVSSQPMKVYKTPITLRTHNSVEDQLQRPASDAGLYTYEAIASADSGQPVRLRSELRIRRFLSDRLGREWWKKLAGEVALGRSKKDDYGSVNLKAELGHEWISEVNVGSNELVVWLVSDTLLRNERLRAEPTAAGLAEELSRLLDVQLTLRNSQDGRLDELVRIRRLDTWHVGWGLPRPTFVALQAGSCVVLTAPEGRLEPSRLAQLEANGIGERTAEGYGQIRFNHPLVTTLLKKDGNAKNPPTGNPGTREEMIIASADPTFAFARLLERECWKQEIHRACLAFASSAQNRKTKLGWETAGEQGKPPMSQLGALRGQLALLRSADDSQKVINWLDHLANNKRRRDKWPSISKVRELLIETDMSIWEIVNTTNWPALTANARQELGRELWPLAVRTFFDTCIRAHKRELEKAQDRKEAANGA